MTGWTYKEAGVDIISDNAFSKIASNLAERTFNNQAFKVGRHVLIWPDIMGMKRPGLLSSTDGVGTKTAYAIAAGRHYITGWDLVAMNVNDLVRQNAVPVLFLDYIGKSPEVTQEVLTSIVRGIVEGCKESNCVLTSGETATMGGSGISYELVGSAVGIVDENSVIDESAIREGDLLFGLPSSGPHANGYSLIRKIFPPHEAVHDAELIDQILQPTQIYTKQVLRINKSFRVHGWAHITGSGIIGKLGDIIPDGLQARIRWDKWPVHEIFSLVQDEGGISDSDMRNTFNMGLGMIGAASPHTARNIVYAVREAGEHAYLIGEVVSTEGERKVV